MDVLQALRITNSNSYLKDLELKIFVIQFFSMIFGSYFGIKYEQPRIARYFGFQSAQRTDFATLENSRTYPGEEHETYIFLLKNRRGNRFTPKERNNPFPNPTKPQKPDLARLSFPPLPCGPPAAILAIRRGPPMARPNLVAPY